MGLDLPAADSTSGYVPLEDRRFVSPAAVNEWIAGDGGTTARSWPEVLHLDRSGAMTCGSRASSMDDIRQWADDPEYLSISRAIGLSEGGCGPNWLIVETRQPWHDLGEASELDAKAFIDLRRRLIDMGVHLVDVVIVMADRCRTPCSLHELEQPGEPYALVDGVGALG